MLFNEGPSLLTIPGQDIKKKINLKKIGRDWIGLDGGGGGDEGGEEYYVVPDVETGARTMEEQCPKRPKLLAKNLIIYVTSYMTVKNL
jgi:hypothetical protein